MKDLLEQDQDVRQAVEELSRLLSDLPQVKEFQTLSEKVAANEKLTRLEEAIKAAQKDAVQFEYYGKPQAKQAALSEADRLTAEYDSLPLVIAYREKLLEVNDLLQYVTDGIQRGVETLLESEPKKDIDK
ncbi:YlbF family regulator [Candidatus Enterococcus leclercqii]|uniref:YlbF family regulator n=1 Tax=Candidatus Enterococcus leclercqii TaxID=1857218 RepID=UPI00137B8035|nr:YlbF family regulator [Enterococcus sp. CU9D]KAF1293424.1 hypothetical protein BAU14_01540 [Enterococcus sp. CU9D]